MSHFRNYFWKQGKPNPLQPCPSNDPLTYKITTDPYRKRFSVEAYALGVFVEVVYDSSLFDFRHLKSEDYASWQREYLDENRTLLRNMDDRIVLMEHFENDDCQILSPQGLLLATQQVMKTANKAPFNGVVLSDPTSRPILIKHYEIDTNGTFTTLLKELWEHMPTIE